MHNLAGAVAVLLALLACPPCLAEQITEAPIQLIELAAPLDRRDAEISSMTWCQNQLILLPQYPDFASRTINSFKPVAGASALYSISRQQIENYLNSTNPQAIKATVITLDEGDARSDVTGFDGYEAIACDGDTFWLSAESDQKNSTSPNPATQTVGGSIFMAQGSLSSSTPTVTIVDQPPLATISQSGLQNSGDEALLIYQNNLISIHEINGSRHVKQPQANVINTHSLESMELSFPAIPYRVTDATRVDQNNRFWVINYKFQDDAYFSQIEDPIAAMHGKGASHLLEDNIERLLEFKINKNSISLTDSKPIQLQLTQEKGRNWEGITRYKTDQRDGFLLITDRFPKTYFGFVAKPDQILRAPTPSATKPKQQR